MQVIESLINLDYVLKTPEERFAYVSNVTLENIIDDRYNELLRRIPSNVNEIEESRQMISLFEYKLSVIKCAYSALEESIDDRKKLTILTDITPLGFTSVQRSAFNHTFRSVNPYFVNLKILLMRTLDDMQFLLMKRANELKIQKKE